MSETQPDPTHPDYEWPATGNVASQGDLAAAIAHVKAWMKREFGKAEPAPAHAAPVPAPSEAIAPAT